MKAKDLNFKVHVGGESERVQKHLFSLGLTWYHTDECTHVDSPYIYVNDNGKIGYGNVYAYFNESQLPELTIAQVLAIQPEKPEPELKPFDKVLVRDDDEEMWRADLFSHKTKECLYQFICVGPAWKQCIPYEGNEHLLGTSEEPK